MATASTAESFWQRTPQGDGCWEWTGAINGARGYGRLTFQGRQALAHRIAWQLTNGPIPAGMLVCHHCDNPRCVRPDHLFLGTSADNLRDSSRKGRMHPGSRHGRAKLTEDQVWIIRELSKEGWRGTAIADVFGIHPNTVYGIVRGREWRHVL